MSEFKIGDRVRRHTCANEAVEVGGRPARRRKLDALLTVLVQVLERLEEDYAGAEQVDNLDGHRGVVELTDQLGNVANAVLEGDQESAQRELVRLASDCISWLEDMED